MSAAGTATLSVSRMTAYRLPQKQALKIYTENGNERNRHSEAWNRRRPQWSWYRGNQSGRFPGHTESNDLDDDGLSKGYIFFAGAVVPTRHVVTYGRLRRILPRNERNSKRDPIVIPGFSKRFWAPGAEKPLAMGNSGSD